MESFYKDNTGAIALILLVVAIFTLLANSLSTFLAWLGITKTKTIPGINGNSPAMDAKLRYLLLDRVEKERIDPFLNQGLRQATRLDVRLTLTPSAVDSSLRRYVRGEHGPEIDAQTDLSIISLFERAARRLLILGDPGTGKTNLLMELARDLIAQAKEDNTCQIPIIFSLPRWSLTKHDKSIGTWLKNDMSAEYGVSRRLATILVDQNHILPLLDGLDEVASEVRGACIDAINQFQRERDLGGLVVCCRSAEYDAMPLLDLWTAVRVETLTLSEVKAELAKPVLAAVRTLCEHNPELWDVVRTPLWFGVLYRSPNVEERHTTEVNASRDHLYKSYVQYALARRAGTAWAQAGPNEIISWLSCLASGMKKRGQSQFRFEDLDYSWLGSGAWSFMARMATSFLVSVFIAICTWDSRDPFIAVGFAVFLATLLTVRAVPMEEIEFIPRKVIDYIPRLLLFALYTVSIMWIAARHDGPAVRIMAARSGLQMAVLGIWPLFVLLIGLNSRPISAATVPNLGSVRSAQYAFRILLAGASLAAVAIAIRRMYFVPRGLWGEESTLPALDIARAVAVAPRIFLVFSILLAMEKGGHFAIRHYILRLCLWNRGLAPLHYVAFLKEAAARLLIVRHGDTFEFFHLSFRDYLASEHEMSSDTTIKEVT